MKSEVEQWEQELRDAGWKKLCAYVWQAPNSALFRGPYQAWRMMKSVEQWGGEPLGDRTRRGESGK